MKENHAPLLVIQEQSYSSFDCLQWREIDLPSLDLSRSEEANYDVKFSEPAKSVRYQRI